MPGAIARQAARASPGSARRAAPTACAPDAAAWSRVPTARAVARAPGSEAASERMRGRSEGGSERALARPVRLIFASAALGLERWPSSNRMPQCAAPPSAERAHARGRRNVLVRHGSRSRRGGDGRGPGWWGSRARVRRVVWHAPRSPRVPSSAPPLVIALPEPVRRPCPSLPRPLGPCREDLCARARASARRFFPPHFFACRAPAHAGRRSRRSLYQRGRGQPTNTTEKAGQSISITPIQASIACPVRPAVGPPGSQAAVGRSEGRGRRAQWSANQPNRAIDRLMATDESIDSSSSASSVVVEREAVLPVCDPVPRGTHLFVQQQEAGGRPICWPGCPP